MFNALLLPCPFLPPPSLSLSSVTLGGFGVDRFYLEQWGSAVGKLFSFGGMDNSGRDLILIWTGYVGPADDSAYIY